VPTVDNQTDEKERITEISEISVQWLDPAAAT
jgi:hypothetical protein